MKKFVITLTALLLAVAMYAEQKRWAVVELSTIYMRLMPDYESPLETQELMGTVVEIVGQKGYWREIVSPQPYKAWCTDKGIVEMSEEEIKAYRNAPKCTFTELYGHIYERPSEKSVTICDLVGGNVMRIAGREKDPDNLLIRKSQRWTKVMLPSGKTGWVRTSQIKPHTGFKSIAKGEGNAESISDKLMEKIIGSAMKLKGVPYLWGGMSPKGVDCSGLVRWSYLMNGILLPRNASQIVHCGDEVALDQMQRGDLVFFGTPAKDGKPQRVTHIGIYLGNNHIIHASHLVRINSLIPGDSDYYENAHRLIAARRL
ncbi:MAG: NlpC/P60 family protein [Bacteroidales bacterium]|nr:NlpC/P60 family protein [Bacteroidales bacterium]